MTAAVTLPAKMEAMMRPLASMRTIRTSDRRSRASSSRLSNARPSEPDEPRFYLEPEETFKPCILIDSISKAA